MIKANVNDFSSKFKKEQAEAQGALQVSSILLPYKEQ